MLLLPVLLLASSLSVLTWAENWNTHLTLLQNWNTLKALTVILKRPNDFVHKDEPFIWHKRLKYGKYIPTSTGNKWRVSLLLLHFFYFNGSESDFPIFLIFSCHLPPLKKDSPQKEQLFAEQIWRKTHSQLSILAISINSHQFELEIEAAPLSTRAASTCEYRQALRASPDPWASTIVSNKSLQQDSKSRASSLT